MVRRLVTVALVLGLSSGARAMTPGSMIGVCYADGSCSSIEGGSLAEVVAQIQKAGKLDAVRDVDVTLFQSPISVAEILHAFGKLTRLELEGRDDPDLAALAGYATLRELSLWHATPKALTAITKLTQLESLDLQNGELTKLVIGARSPTSRS